MSSEKLQVQQSSNNIVDPPEESPYTCPVCLSWLKDPMLTSCGHRFCKNCIESWLERESSCCPIDNIPLRSDKDIFPDNFTRREISQQKTKCPNIGCNIELTIVEMESHICPFDLTEPKQLDCTFFTFGCNFKGNSTEEIDRHSSENIQQHLTLMSQAYTNLNIRKSSSASKTEESKLWDPPPKENDTSTDKSHELIRAMYERLIILEQRTHEQEITCRNLRKEINELKTINQTIINDTRQQFCGGIYIWSISDFKSKLDTMIKDHNKMYYSEGFFTSPFGYRFCARLNLSPKNPDFLGLLVHVMQSTHNNCLDWPFNGKISLTIVHPMNSYYNIKETMMTRPDLEAFQQPHKLMNPLGFGYTEFILIDELFSKGFVHNNCLTVKIQVQTV